jgi:hypothetical protein
VIGDQAHRHRLADVHGNDETPISEIPLTRCMKSACSSPRMKRAICTSGLE